ncbi:MAG: germination protein YpeB [Ruminococcaceae bacterium]|nr:germination protein YpeB [Oscillospiraceae bacterium]
MNNKFKSAPYLASLIGIIIFSLVLGVMVKKDGENKYLKNQINDVYSRSILQVVDSINDVDTALIKSSVTNSPYLLSDLSNEIYRQATFAKANLGELPLGDTDLEKTSKFLSQVGDFTYSISNKVLNGGFITDEEKNHLATLSKYASKLSDALSGIETKLMSGKLTFDNKAYAEKNAQIPISNTFTDIEKDFIKYPSLIYDGPFSDHINKLEARHLKSEKEITKDDAKNKVKNFVPSVKNINIEGESDGTIKTFILSGTDENETSFYTEVSKFGGKVLYMLKNRDVKSTKLSTNDAINAGSAFLIKNELYSMKESYYEINNNIMTVNYAYVENGIIMYPDLIKLKIALDNGEILGYEAQGYLMAHEEGRNLNEISIPIETARNLVSKNLKIEKENMAVIPLDGGSEVLCYEFTGTFNKKTFIIYINATTGKEEQILMLLVKENGTLTL